jgi:3-hydroxyacyl-[acyl-carrier-protein] dehydratase
MRTEEEEEKSRAGARRARLRLDRGAIERRIPHREPFLFLDEVALEGETAVASWRVPEDAGFFRGHYPGNPITPGVILCEHAFQAAAVLLSELGQGHGETGGVPVLARIEKAKFRRMVRPGESLRTEVRLAERAGPAAFLEAKAWVGEELAMEVRCALARAEGAR